MSRKLFISLPVSDLERSKAFFAALGFTFNPQFTDQNAACMVVSEHNFVMLLAEPFFKTFIDKPIVDARTSAEALVAFDCESREAVDAVMAAGLKAGGKELNPARDHGFMYQRTLEDLDGHVWEPFWMEPERAQF